jgi:hypothetical protein
VAAVRALTLVVALFALFAAGCGSGSAEEASPTTPTSTEAAPPAAATDRPLAPVIDGTTLDGAAASLDDYRGRAVFVNVWSSW